MRSGRPADAPGAARGPGPEPVVLSSWRAEYRCVHLTPRPEMPGSGATSQESAHVSTAGAVRLGRCRVRFGHRMASGRCRCDPQRSPQRTTDWHAPHHPAAREYDTEERHGSIREDRRRVHQRSRSRHCRRSRGVRLRSPGSGIPGLLPYAGPQELVVRGGHEGRHPADVRNIRQLPSNTARSREAPAERAARPVTGAGRSRGDRARPTRRGP